MTRRTHGTVRDPRDMASSIFSSEYSSVMADRKAKWGRQPSPSPTYALIGICTPQGQAEVIRYCSPSFEKLIVKGVTVVGWPEDIALFRRCYCEVAGQIKGRRLADDGRREFGRWTLSRASLPPSVKSKSLKVHWGKSPMLDDHKGDDR